MRIALGQINPTIGDLTGQPTNRSKSTHPLVWLLLPGVRKQLRRLGGVY